MKSENKKKVHVSEENQVSEKKISIGKTPSLRRKETKFEEKTSP